MALITDPFEEYSLIALTTPRVLIFRVLTTGLGYNTTSSFSERTFSKLFISPEKPLNDEDPLVTAARRYRIS